MANGLTNRGQDIALWQANPAGAGGQGGIAGWSASIRLYTSSSNVNGFKAGIVGAGGFVEPAVANGYAPIPVQFSSWVRSIVAGNVQIVLQPAGADPQWVASGGSIDFIAGAFLMGGVGGLEPLGWWERTPASAVSLAPGDSLTLDDLTIRLI